jgi:LPS export ABC transporter protein LptC
MFSFKNKVYYLLGSIRILLGVLMLFSCTNDPNDVKAVSRAKELPVEWADDVTMLYSDQGMTKVYLHAPRLEKYAGGKERYTLMPQGIHAVFYDSAMSPRSSIAAGYAVEYPDRRTVEARSNIRVVNETGDTLYTESLLWERSRQLISTNAPVRIVTHENEVIYGENGMESDERFTKWRIRNVKESVLFLKESDDTNK